MEATLAWDVKLSSGINLNEGDWFEIFDFKLTYASGLIRPTKNKYHIILTRNAVVRKISLITEFTFLCCANYKIILRGLSHTKFCIDLCGALVHVGPIDHDIKVQYNPNMNDGHKSRIKFFIMNIDFAEINCVTYGTVADKLYENWLSSTAQVVVGVLRLWRIEWGDGFHSIENDFKARYLKNLTIE
ncbi:unnamed protein product [Eruca vesicaria subsp. sativa]|uniref:DUF223 domain-containing protein n=1 Tax=Eruca vesicaria subsp. sativa TaxID=29727 RepID=A0ABC8JI01_ERUVS|nr:unnamed protein product [Eruca vesicaria subsp. sativa]